MNNIDWSQLGFAYMKTPYNVRCTYKNGSWGDIEVHTEDTIPIHIAATCLHYGQETFEGLKAFGCPDGKTRIFRMDENAKRMISSANYLKMAAPSIELFEDMVKRVIELNKEYVPPYTSGASLYIRPVLIGTGAQVGVKPADEYMLIMFVSPVGAYFGKNNMMKAMIEHVYDRAAPHGTGHVKVGGNYAASLTPNQLAQEKGYDNVFYLDPATKRYIDECGAANFFGIKGKTYVTPNSSSVLPSITNMSLCTLAEEIGLKVERRNIPIDELSSFSEAGACGTAAVITPIGRIDDLKTGISYTYGDVSGEYCTALRKKLVAIQYGLEPDTYKWVTIL